MIKSYRSKSLQALHLSGDTRGVQTGHVKRLKLILSALNTAEHPGDLRVSGWRLHRYAESDVWSVDVDGAWRVTFRFDGKNAEEVWYGQPH